MSGDPTRVEGVRPPDRTPGPGPAATNGAGAGAGINVQSGTPSGTETELDAPGMASDKRADDTR